MLQAFNSRTVINSAYLNIVDRLSCIFGLKTWLTFISPYQGQILLLTNYLSSWFGEQELSLGSGQRKQTSPMDMFQCGSVHICKDRNELQPTAQHSPTSKQVMGSKLLICVGHIISSQRN